FGLAAYAVPALILLLGWKWIQSSPIATPSAKTFGAMLLLGSTCAALGMAISWRPIAGVIPAGGLLGAILADYLLASMNFMGAALFTGACWVVSIYLVSTFEMSRLPLWFRGPIAWARAIAAKFAAGWSHWRENRARAAKERAEKRELKKALAEKSVEPKVNDPAPVKAKAAKAGASASTTQAPPIVDPLDDMPPFDPTPELDDIPIHTLETLPQPPAPIEIPPAAVPVLHERRDYARPTKPRADFRLPSTSLLQEPPARTAYDSGELKEIAGRIKSKFEEFNVHGSVTQINPGPVVTTFEFKPEAGVKYSRITTLSEDLCLGLQAESILIE